MVGCLIFPTDDHACADRQPREIAKVGRLCVGRIPEFGLNRLQLRQNGSAVGIIGRDPVNGLEIGRIVGVSLGFITVYRFLLAARHQLRFFRGSFLAVKLV